MISKINETGFYQLLIERKKDKFINLINETCSKCELLYPKIDNIFSTYTLHGMKHSLNVMEYMYDLIDDVNKISDLDIVLCVYAALFHDIGMVVFDDEIEKIKNNEDKLVEYDYKVLLSEYGNEKIALQECIRPIHGKRVGVIINRSAEEMDDLFFVPNTRISFKKELIDICQSHNEDFSWVSKMLDEKIIKEEYSGNPKFVALLLRLADLLDIDENRAPEYLYKMVRPTGVSDEEWKKHFILENKKKINFNTKLQCKELQFYGTSTDPDIHRSFLSYLHYLNIELENAVNLSEKFMENQYILKISPKPKQIIKTEGFSFADFKLNLDYNAVTSLLMGENIYGDKKYGLREILQNSIDACKVFKEYFNKNSNGYESYSPQIKISIDKEQNKVSIFDNGSGMSLNILKNYFLNVGVSYYKSKDFRFKGYEYQPIGNYGIGFLACFMLSNDVKIMTKHISENYTHTIMINRNSEFICVSNESVYFNHGTEIILNYNEFISVFKNVESVKDFIKSNFIGDEVPILLNSSDGQKNESISIELNSLDKMIDKSISLSNYFNDIEIFVQAKFSKSCFFENLNDLTKIDSYFYNKDDLSLHNETEINLKEYVSNNLIKYLKVAIVEEKDADEFNTALEYLNDYEEALDRIYPGYAVIVYTDNQYVGYSNIGKSDRIIEDYSFENLVVDFNQSKYADAYIYKEKQNVIIGDKNKMLGYKTNIRIGEYIFNCPDKVYCKDVLVKNAKLEIPYLLNGFNVTNVVINSKNRYLLPNVTRNDFSNDLKKDLSYAVGKALHLWVLANVKLDFEEKNLIEKFLNQNYYEPSKYLKN